MTDLVVSYRMAYEVTYGEPCALPDGIVQTCIERVGVLETSEETDKAILYEMEVWFGN